MLPAVVLLDPAGRLLRPSIQQSDARCGAEVDELRAEIDEKAFLAKAGNGVNQQLVAGKLSWIERHEPEVFSRIGTVFGSYDYINWRLTGERAIEQNWALEAGFVDLKTHAIDDDLVALAHIPRAALPRKVASHEILGVVSSRGAAESGLMPGTPVIGGAADMIASALGAGVVSAGDVLLKFGGAVDILTATDQARPDPRLFLDYHLKPGLFVPNGCMATGGSALNWFVRQFASGEASAAASAGLSIHQWLDRLAEARPAGSDGLIITPYFLGEKTPIHDPGARATFDGLTLSHDIGHVWRALLEAYAYAIAHHVEVLREIGYGTERFIVSDGGSTSRVWMQIVADVVQQPVQRLAGHPGSCVGAAWTAAIGADLASDWSAISAFVRPADRIEPRREVAETYARGYRRYREIYRPPRRAAWAEPVMSAFRAVAWDLDGTLIDSEGLHQRALIETSAAFGADLSDLPDEAFRGVHMRDVWTTLKPRFPNGVERQVWLAAIERFYVARRPRSRRLPARSKRFARSRRSTSRRPACRIRAVRSSTPIWRRSEYGRRSHFRSVLKTCPLANPIPNPIAKLRAASRCRARRLSPSRTAPRAPVRRERRGSMWSATRPREGPSSAPTDDREADGSDGFVQDVSGGTPIPLSRRPPFRRHEEELGRMAGVQREEGNPNFSEENPSRNGRKSKIPRKEIKLNTLLSFAELSLFNDLR